MPRLRNEVTGVVVNVSDETAALLGADYKPVEAEKKAPAKRASSKTEK
jgi:hypothetical protein